MHLIRVCLFTALATSCGGDLTPEDCGVDPANAYLTTYVPASGDCGPLNQELSMLNPPDSSSCHSMFAVDDSCAATDLIQCVLPSGGVRRVTYVLHRDGNDWQGTMELSLPSGTSKGPCHGFYNVRLNRQ